MVEGQNSPPESPRRNRPPQVSESARRLSPRLSKASVSAIPEIIKDGENGFIIEPENPELLADKIREIVLMPEEKLYEIRCRAQSDVQDISSVDKTMQTYVDVLKKSF